MDNMCVFCLSCGSSKVQGAGPVYKDIEEHNILCYATYYSFSFRFLRDISAVRGFFLNKNELFEPVVH